MSQRRWASERDKAQNPLVFIHLGIHADLKTRDIASGNSSLRDVNHVYVLCTRRVSMDHCSTCLTTLVKETIERAAVDRAVSSR